MVLHIFVLCFNHLCKYCFNFYSTELKAKNIFKMVTINNMKLMNSSKLFHPFNNLLQVHCKKKKFCSKLHSNLMQRVITSKMVSQRAMRKNYEDSPNLYAFT